MYNECTSQGYMVSPFPSPLSCGHYDASGVLREAALRKAVRRRRRRCLAADTSNFVAYVMQPFLVRQRPNVRLQQQP
jgi:hypothetical protein